MKSSKKSIIFILDSFELYSFSKNDYLKRTYCYSYFDTENAINYGLDNIVTYDLGHLSFDLEELGYDIFIGYNGFVKQFYTGMHTANGKELRFGHNLRRLLLGGALDNDLNIDRKKIFWYDKTKSTSDLCKEAKELQSSILSLATKICEQTIGWGLSPMKFEDIGKNVKNLIESATKGKWTTNGANGITEQLIAKEK